MLHDLIDRRAFLALAGKRVPSSLKIFLLALAIMDDLGAIVIIALFYSGDLATSSLILAAFCLLALVLQSVLFGLVHLGKSDAELAMSFPGGLALGYVASGLLFCITIIGIPFAVQHIKLIPMM